MKKLLLSAFLCAGAFITGAAQDLYFQTENGTRIENGSTVLVEDFIHYPQGDVEQIMYLPDIFIVSESGGFVNVQVHSNLSVNLCVGGLCESGTDPIKENVQLFAGVPQDLQLDYMTDTANFETFQPPLVEAVVEAWYFNDPKNKITITVKMGDVNAGVEGVAATLDNVVFTGSSLNYDLSHPGQLSLYSLSGKMLLSQSVSGSGSISLANLSKGIYLYRVANKNGKVVKSSKIIIK